MGPPTEPPNWFSFSFDLGPSDVTLSSSARTASK